MTKYSYNPQALTVRDDLADAIKQAWQHLSGPGTWWTAEDRLKMVAETRHAASCDLCARSKEALSPYATKGDHDTVTDLPATVIEVIHRIMTDAGRLTENWLKGLQQNGLSDSEYIEVVSIVATVAGLDTFNHALGLPFHPLPELRAGVPSRNCPPGLNNELAWVRTLTSEGLEEYIKQHSPEALPKVFPIVNIHLALSLVPDEVIAFFNLDCQLYLTSSQADTFDEEFRAISHPQIELIAGKAASINNCEY